jgi:putative tryptophan/tyrosine transport system substrate-binding protein
MRRREFITLFGGAASWPLAARAQQAGRIRHVGVLTGFDDPDLKAFQQELKRLGWSEGQNLHTDYRYSPAGTGAEALARELVALQPEVILAQSRPAITALQKATDTIPIVFIFVTDPIGAGFIRSLPRPGGNITGFELWEPTVAGKWLGLLKQIAPQTTHVGLLGNPKTAPYYDYLLDAATAAASSLGMELIPSRIENDTSDIERVVKIIADAPYGSIVVVPDSTTNNNRDLIIALAARNRLPAVYAYRFFVNAGGLMSYGIVNADQYRQGATYVDQILRGAKPGDLPVQTPTKYETVLNSKTLKNLGLIAPEALLVAADEIIE